MTTKLTEPLRREIEIDGEAYTVLLTPQGLRLSRKRFRQGRHVTWRLIWDQGEPESPESTDASG
ncbi:MAG: hypothetical protein JWL61_4771 [Gemmatimonadetes bacterium]|jgi:hypothetical protein|nr:hypothetical protein [Gemmatimonadota bacterium]